MVPGSAPASPIRAAGGLGDHRRGVLRQRVEAPGLLGLRVDAQRRRSQHESRCSQSDCELFHRILLGYDEWQFQRVIFQHSSMTLFYPHFHSVRIFPTAGVRRRPIRRTQVFTADKASWITW